MDIDLKQLRELMRALKQFDLEELEVEKNGERIKLRRALGTTNFIAPAATMPPPSHDITASPATIPPSATVDDPTLTYITSPFVGTFYAAPSPNAPNFVDVGASIRAGQTLCIVEAMKLMNEIESEMSGTIVEVLVASGKPVEYGEKLFRVRKG